MNRTRTRRPARGSALRAAALRTALVRTAAVIMLAAALGVSSVASAAAHVTVRADSTTPGAYSALTFRVPNESETAGTVTVSVTLPQDTPFVHVSSRPVPGWTVVAAKEPLPRPVESNGATITEAVRTVTWTADRGTRIGPGEYQEFSLSVGPLPTPQTILLPATQTYSDGTVVRWEDAPVASGAEPEHPAPLLVVTAAAGATDAATPGSTAPVAPAQPDLVARGLGVAGLVVGLAGLLAAGWAVRRRRVSA